MGGSCSSISTGEGGVPGESCRSIRIALLSVHQKPVFHADGVVRTPRGRGPLPPASPRTAPELAISGWNVPEGPHPVVLESVGPTRCNGSAARPAGRRPRAHRSAGRSSRQGLQQFTKLGDGVAVASSGHTYSRVSGRACRRQVTCEADPRPAARSTPVYCSSRTAGEQVDLPIRPRRRASGQDVDRSISVRVVVSCLKPSAGRAPSRYR